LLRRKSFPGRADGTARGVIPPCAERRVLGQSSFPHPERRWTPGQIAFAGDDVVTPMAASISRRTGGTRSREYEPLSAACASAVAIAPSDHAAWALTIGSSWDSRARARNGTAAGLPV